MDIKISTLIDNETLEKKEIYIDTKYKDFSGSLIGCLDVPIIMFYNTKYKTIIIALKDNLSSLEERYTPIYFIKPDEDPSTDGLKFGDIIITKNGNGILCIGITKNTLSVIKISFKDTISNLINNKKDLFLNLNKVIGKTLTIDTVTSFNIFTIVSNVQMSNGKLLDRVNKYDSYYLFLNDFNQLYSINTSNFEDESDFGVIENSNATNQNETRYFVNKVDNQLSNTIVDKWPFIAKYTDETTGKNALKYCFFDLKSKSVTSSIRIYLNYKFNENIKSTYSYVLSYENNIFYFHSIPYNNRYRMDSSHVIIDPSLYKDQIEKKYFTTDFSAWFGNDDDDKDNMFVAVRSLRPTMRKGTKPIFFVGKDDVSFNKETVSICDSNLSSIGRSVYILEKTNRLFNLPSFTLDGRLYYKGVLDEWLKNKNTIDDSSDLFIPFAFTKSLFSAINFYRNITILTYDKNSMSQTYLLGYTNEDSSSIEIEDNKVNSITLDDLYYLVTEAHAKLNANYYGTNFFAPLYYEMGPLNVALKKSSRLITPFNNLNISENNLHFITTMLEYYGRIPLFFDELLFSKYTLIVPSKKNSFAFDLKLFSNFYIEYVQSLLFNKYNIYKFLSSSSDFSRIIVRDLTHTINNKWSFYRNYDKDAYEAHYQTLQYFSGIDIENIKDNYIYSQGFRQGGVFRGTDESDFELFMDSILYM